MDNALILTTSDKFDVSDPTGKARQVGNFIALVSALGVCLFLYLRI